MPIWPVTIATFRIICDLGSCQRIVDPTGVRVTVVVLTTSRGPSPWRTPGLARRGRLATKVYDRCMSRTNIDVDDEACRVVMQRYHLATKREAVNLALRRLAGEPLDVDAARALRGAGWDGDLELMRASRVR